MLTWNPAEPTATRPLALQISGTWFTYGLDLSKNVTELFTTAGGVETCYTYSPFGAVIEDGDTTSPIQWSSEVYDSELALVYYNYRSYNPQDGRWINRDPIGIRGGLNLYGYVGNRVWLWDVLGLNNPQLIKEVSDDITSNLSLEASIKRYDYTFKFNDSKKFSPDYVPAPEEGSYYSLETLQLTGDVSYKGQIENIQLSLMGDFVKQTVTFKTCYENKELDIKAEVSAVNNFTSDIFRVSTQVSSNVYGFPFSASMGFQYTNATGQYDLIGTIKVDVFEVIFEATEIKLQITTEF
ncbi:MAG: RHS repeat-associated core domain-containing protein [Rikenellaceae bacterium]